MKIVALDVGSKRIGVATADTAVRIAVPHSTIEVDGTEFEQIAKIMKNVDSKHLVVGLPRNGQGEETAQSETVRSFIVALLEYFVNSGLEKPLVKYQDESLTSVKAEENLAMAKRRKQRPKGDIDREAATLILQDFLDTFSPEAMSDSEAVNEEADGAGRIETMEEDIPDAKKKSKRRSKAFRIFATVVGLLIIAVVGVIVWYTDGLKPVDPNNCQHESRCEQQEFIILDGESVGVVASRLAEKKLIKSDLAFRAYLKLEQREKAIKAGVYLLNSGMTAADIVNVFEDGSDTRVFRLEIPAGESIDAVKRRLVAVGYEESAVNAAFEKKYSNGALGDKELAVSEFLYADMFEIGVGASVEGILTLMLGRVAAVSENNGLASKYSAMGLDFSQAHGLAGRVRAEVGEKSEYAKVEIAKAAELIGNDDVEGVAGVAVDLYALVGVAYYESKLPYVVSGDYAGWKNVYGDLAKEVGAKNGIPYEAILAQSILESSWGKSKLAYKYFNFFGIKYVNMPTGSGVAPTGSVNMTTWEEYKPGVSTTINADFAAWDSVEKGFSAYAAWIKAQSRYAGALKYPNDAVRYVEELKKGGYATDSNYVATLTSIIDSLRKI